MEQGTAMNGSLGAKIDQEPRKQGEMQSSPFSSFVSEDEALAYLADVLVQAYFEQRKYARTNQAIH